MLTLKERLNVTRRFAEIIAKEATVCYMHIKASVTYASMRTRFNHATLKYRLVIMSQSRTNLKYLFTNNNPRTGTA